MFLKIQNNFIKRLNRFLDGAKRWILMRILLIIDLLISEKDKAYCLFYAKSFQNANQLPPQNAGTFSPYRFYSFLYFFIAFNTVLFAQSYDFQKWSVGDGLGQSQVYALLEDRRGYIWIGTQGGGLNRFNGLDFQIFTSRDSLSEEAMADNFVYALCEDRDGNLWIGTRRGVSRFDGQRFVHFELLIGRGVSVNAIAEDAAGVLWLGTTEGIFNINGEMVTHFSQEKNLPSTHIYSVYVDGKQRLWFGSTVGAILVRGEEVQIFNQKNKKLPGNDVTGFAKDEKGSLWMSIFGVGIGVLHRDTFRLTKARSGRAPVKVLNLLTDTAGQIWAGTQDAGLFIWQAKERRFTQLNEQSGLSKNDVRVLLEDSWGSLWVGTSGGGLNKYAGQKFTHFDRDQGLLENFVYAVEEDGYGRIWFSAYDEGVSYFDGQFFHHPARTADSLRFVAKTLFKDRENRLWIGTERKGLVLFDGEQYQFFNQQQGFPDAPVRDILQDSLGTIWVATAGGGIVKMMADITDAKRFYIQKFTRAIGLPSDKINALYLDDQQRLWFATRWRGVGYLLDNEVVKVFDQKGGLPSEEVRCLAADSLENLWIGTARGVARINLQGARPQIVPSNDNQKLRYKNIYLLQFDREGYLWIGSQRGVERAQLDASQNIVETKFFDQSEGFIGIETCQNAVCEDRFGNLWFGTMNGLTKYTSGTAIKNLVPPNLHFTDIQLLYKPLYQYADYQFFVEKWGGIKTGLSLQPNEHNLSFQFFATNPPNPEQVRYCTKLIGVESAWSPPTSETQVRYPQLPPGDYTFQVKACNEDGVWTPEPIEATFTILPHFWQTWWFKASTVIGILSLFLVILKTRLNQVRRTAQRINERLEMEKKVLELEQKALQLQMNPHFIFNALNSIQSLIVQKDHQTARYHLAKFSKLMRAILENSRRPMISLEQELEILEVYLTLEQFSRDNAFQFQINTPAELEVEEIEIPPMMIQPFVENAIIHGVAHLEKGGNIEIAFKEAGDILECMITDNGIGRAKAQKIKSQQAHQHKSMALEVTQERLDILNRALKGRKSLEIEDLVSIDGKALGTQVRIQFSLKNHT